MRGSLAILLLAACSRIDSSGPPSAEQLTTACIKYSACSQTSLVDCLNHSGYAESIVSVYRPKAIRCLVNAPAECGEVAACVDDECPGNLCEAGTCATPLTASCDGSRIAACDFSGTLTTFDCAVYDETCKQDTDGAHCGAAHATPCGNFGAWCTGETFVQCTGEERRVECGSLYEQGTCLQRTVRCGYADDCSVDQPPSCLDNDLVVCTLGTVVRTSCTELGFAQCSNGACIL